MRPLSHNLPRLHRNMSKVHLQRCLGNCPRPPQSPRTMNNYYCKPPFLRGTPNSQIKTLRYHNFPIFWRFATLRFAFSRRLHLYKNSRAECFQIFGNFLHLFQLTTPTSHQTETRGLLQSTSHVCFISFALGFCIKCLKLLYDCTRVLTGLQKGVQKEKNSKFEREDRRNGNTLLNQLISFCFSIIFLSTLRNIPYFFLCPVSISPIVQK